MKCLCLLVSTTLLVVFVSLTYAAPTQSEQAEIEFWRDAFRTISPYLKKAARYYLDNYGNVEAQDLSAAEVQRWRTILLKALPGGAVLRSALPFVLRGLSRGNEAAVNRKGAVIQEILRGQQVNALSEGDVLKGIQNLLAGKLEGAAEEQGMDFMPAIESLPEETQAQFIGSLLGALTGGLGKLFG